jgi:hypothetical protein
MAVRSPRTCGPANACQQKYVRRGTTKDQRQNTHSVVDDVHTPFGWTNAPDGACAETLLPSGSCQLQERRRTAIASRHPETAYLHTPAHSHRVPRRHAAALPRLHEPREATSLFVILIPIIAGRVLHATRAVRAAHDPEFRSALPRRLFPLETLNRSRFPKLHSGPSKPSGDSAIRTTHTSDRHIRCPPAAEGEGTWNRSPSKPQPTS